MSPYPLSLPNLITTLTGKLLPLDVPDLSGKVALITGFNSGIGYETARTLLEHGAEVIGVSRSDERGHEAAEQLKQQVPGAKISVKICNLELLGSVKSLADELLASGTNINLLINNAGRFLDETFSVTKEGIEHTMAVNFYGHAYLTLLLLEKMASNGPGRIVNMISEAEVAGTLDWSDMKGTHLGSSGTLAYGRAKLMLMLFTFELQRRLRLAGAAVEAFAVHPGFVASRLFDKVTFKYPLALFGYLACCFWGLTPEQGAISSIYAATSPKLTGRGGQYFGPSYTLNIFCTGRRMPKNPKAHQPDAWRRLWDESEVVIEEVTGQQLPRTLPPVTHCVAHACEHGAQ